MSLTLLIGGARSGKSSLAVEWGRRHGGPVTYIATAPAQDVPVPTDAAHDRDEADDEDANEAGGHGEHEDRDDDLAARIERHRAERPASWSTVEEQVDLAGALDRANGTVIVDCLTLWTSNLMWHGRSDDDIDRLAIETAGRAAEYGRPVLAITNEVGLGVHPATELGRRYRDVLGRVNQRWAAIADRSLLLVAGRAVDLRDPWQLLPPTSGTVQR